MVSRGAFIVLEGCDRAGKTTQCKLIVEMLGKSNHKAELMSFPNRNTECGKVLDSYLSNKSNLPDECIHLLFTANRWELASEIEKKLKSGTTLIVDRYSFSGVAFSVAKGLSLQWCKNAEQKLPKPDLVLYLTLSPEEQQKRGGFGLERYEYPELQRKVQTVYTKLFDPEFWLEVDAGKSQNQLNAELTGYVKQTMEKVKDQPLKELWVQPKRSS